MSGRLTFDVEVIASRMLAHLAEYQVPIYRAFETLHWCSTSISTILTTSG